MEIKARHVPGRLNVWADELSRRKGIQNTEWSLHPQILEEIWKLMERPMIDLFATRHNNKMQMFFSPIPDEKAGKVDVLSISWNGLYAYAFPPTALIDCVEQDSAVQVSDSVNSTNVAKTSVVSAATGVIDREANKITSVKIDVETTKVIDKTRESTDAQVTCVDLIK